MKRKTFGVLALGAATVGLIVLGSGTAMATDPTCLVESVEHTAEDPAGVVHGTVEDPVGTVESDLECAHEVAGV